MAPHIVSWGANPPPTSPVSSGSPSVVSFDSILSDVQLPELPEAHGATGTGANSVNPSTGEPSASLKPASAYPGLDDSFVRHDTYFFKDGNVTFLVDGTLYCVHRFFFSRDSVYFSTRLVRLGTRDHEALPTVVSLGDVEREDFEALLSVIYPKDFEEHLLSYKQWKSVLHLSTRWSFASIRKLALKSINPPTSHDRLVLARTYAVEEWVLPALTAMCERAEPVSLAEALQMRIEDVVLVAAVREDARSHVLRVDAAKVTRIVEAALAGKLGRNEDDSAPRANPEGGAANEGASSTTAASPAGARREGGTESSGHSSEGKGVTKSPKEKTAQDATRPAQAAPKHEGEQVPKLFSGHRPFGIPPPAGDSLFSSTTAKITIPNPLAGKQEATRGQGLFANAENSSTSTHETPKPSGFSFAFGRGVAATPSPLFGTPLQPVEIGSPSAVPPTQKATAPRVNPTDSKGPVKK